VKILGISGSPRTEGNTTYALEYALDKAARLGAQTVFMTLADRPLTPCNACFTCRSGECVFDDGMAELYRAMRAADGIILASPVYMGLVSGQTKVMMDRTVLFRASGRFELSGKVGAGIACGGARNGGQELTLQCMHTYFLQQDMFVTADGPPGSHSGAAIVGKARDDAVGLSTVDSLVRRMVRAIEKNGT